MSGSTGLRADPSAKYLLEVHRVNNVGHVLALLMTGASRPLVEEVHDHLDVQGHATCLLHDGPDVLRLRITLTHNLRKGMR